MGGEGGRDSLTLTLTLTPLPPLNKKEWVGGIGVREGEG